MMKRLFMLRFRKNGPAVNDGKQPIYFDNKMRAKATRDVIRREDPQATVVVSYGPDHRLYKGD